MNFVDFISNTAHNKLDLFSILIISIVIFDITLGFAKGWVNQNFDSTTARKGIVSHLGTLIILLGVKYFTSVVTDLHEIHAFVNVFALLVIIAYLISILENLAELWAPIPQGLIDKLKKLKEDKEHL